MHAQVLNEPKHNIKGGDISVQAAAPKSDRFNERAGGGYGGGTCMLAVYSHVCMVWISFSDTHTLGLPRARERSVPRTRAHAHIQVMAVGMVADTTAAVVATAGTCIGCLCHSPFSVRL